MADPKRLIVITGNIDYARTDLRRAFDMSHQPLPKDQITYVTDSCGAYNKIPGRDGFGYIVLHPRNIPLRHWDTIFPLIASRRDTKELKTPEEAVLWLSGC